MPAYQRAKQGPETQNHNKANKPEGQTGRKMNPHQMLESPETMEPQDVLTAQQQLGNQVVQRALGETENRQALTDQQGNLRNDISSSIQQSRGSGSSLSKDLQTEMSRKLGHDFSSVRLHTDGTADKLSRTINARAFTIGTDVFFKNGVYAPGTQKGRETLIHELTHVVQQSKSGKASGGKLKLGAPNTAMEQEADRRGKQGSLSAVANTSAGAVQRVEEEEEMVQGQPEDEEEIVQGQPEDEEEIVQGQPEDEEEIVQGQPEDEEEIVQGQPEEEEGALQRQPDAGGVIQRLPSLDEIMKKIKRKSPEKKPTTPVTKPSANVVSGMAKVVKPAQGIAEIEKQRQDKFKRLVSQPGETKNLSKSAQRVKLVNTLKNPNASEEDRKKAEDNLRTFHKAGRFKKNPATVALKERRKMLKEKASAGDEKAAELYKKEKKPSLFQRAKGFYSRNKDDIKMVTGGISKVASFLGIGGGGKDKEEKSEKGSGGGDGGGYAVIISQLMQENKMLREKLSGKSS